MDEFIRMKRRFGYVILIFASTFDRLADLGTLLGGRI